MIGKTNSIVVKGGDTPTPATTDRYKGLRPSYWPTIKMPDEFPNDNYIHTQLLLWIPAGLSASEQQEVQLFNYEGRITDIVKVDWGDGVIDSYVENYHMYNTNTPANAPQGSFYVVEITSTAVPTYYNSSYSDYYRYEILEMSCRCNIERQYTVIENLSATYAKPYIRFISIHSKDGKIVFQSEFPSLLLYPYMKSSTNGGLITAVSDVNLIGGSLIEIPDIYSIGVNLIIGSGKYTSLPAPNNETGEQLVYSSIDIRTSKNENGYINSSALDVLPILDVGTIYNSITVQPNNSPLECLAIADLSQLSVVYENGGQENYTWGIWGRERCCVLSPKISFSDNDTSAKGIFYNCSNLKEITIISWGGLSAEDALQNAFYNCSKLQIVRMPENSLKVPIDLSNITQTYSNYYTDPETGNGYNSTTDFLLKTVAKGLYNFTSAGETPSYTPTLTLSNNVNSYASSIYIDGTQFPEYITNKGWTIAEA